jgi:hypothetical protein
LYPKCNIVPKPGYFSGTLCFVFQSKCSAKEEMEKIEYI